VRLSALDSQRAAPSEPDVPGALELRKDPITRSWVVIREGGPRLPAVDPCPLCPGNEHLTPPPTLLSLPEAAGEWRVRVFPHFDPLFRIEGDTARAAEGIYDRMRLVGAHEIVVELRAHDRPLTRAADADLVWVLEAFARRLTDLKKDDRFKYVSVFKNAGPAAGQELRHAYAQIAATTFVPRRVLHELRSARDYHQLKERCLFCDMVRQELAQRVRLLEATDRFLAFCPFASRVPYETWILPRRHHHSFEADFLHLGAPLRLELAGLLRRTLARVEGVTESYHLALHTSPNTTPTLERIGFWRTLEEDFHWHFELLPVTEPRPRPHFAKEVYFTTVAPETAATQLRGVPLDD
jgi:UDPglucose--hexose-1-phosphate uridylyltransferase